MPRKGEARNVRSQVVWVVYDSQTDTCNRGRITEEPCAAKVACTVLKQRWRRRPLHRFCQVVDAEMLISQSGASLRSYPPFRRPAPSLSLRPNSRIAAASLDDSRPLTTDAVAGESVG